MAQKLSALPIGAKVKFGKLHNTDIIWVVAHKDYPGYPSNSATLLTEQIIKLMCFDAAEPSSTVGDRATQGNNNYKVSNIRQWLNSAAAAGAWYSAQHSTDAPPIAYNVYGNFNTYYDAAGFLNAFTANERNALLDTTLLSVAHEYDGGGNIATVDKMFLLSVNEVGKEAKAISASAFAYFKNTAKHTATVSASGISNSNYSGGGLVAGVEYMYNLRDARTASGENVNCVLANGDIGGKPACYGTMGLRPACNISQDTLVTDTTDVDGCYTLVFNRAPFAPSYINVPESIYEGQTAELAWGLATDEDGNLAGYVLEQKVNSNAWEVVYTGTDRSYTVPAMYGVDTVQYRVKAYDTDNAVSSYISSATITVIKNRAPEITGADGDLGTFDETPPSFSYIVRDADADAVTVVEKLDGKVIKEYAATLEAENTITFNADAWIKVVNGLHTFEVVATDAEGGTAKRTMTFTKNVNYIAFEKTVAVEASEMPTRALVNIQGRFPDGCNLHVWMCNNGNDASPAWEDVTQEALNGGKHYFANTTKTAASWGVKLKVRLERGTATETCYIMSVGGNFA